MKRIIEVALVFSLNFLCVFVSQGQSGNPATLKGKVTDSIDALVPFMPIEFTNGVRNYKVNTNGDGEYDLALEPGKYKVSVGGSSGFGVTHRSEILLEPDASKTFHLKVYPAGLFLVDVSDGSTQCTSGIDYQDVPALSTVGVTSGMVRYGLNYKKRSLLTFKPFSKLSDQVIFTYDFFTATADTIRIDERTKEIYAIGNITIELENKIEKYKGTVKIHIKKGKATYKKV